MRTVLRSGVCALLGVAAMASARASEYQPMIEIGTGYEFQGSEITVPTLSDPAHAVDTSRGDLRFTLTVEALNFVETGPGGEVTTVKLFPIYLELDPSAESDAFGRVVGIDGTRTPVRRVVGTLLDVHQDYAEGLFSVRGKLVSVEYDRDKGIWDWRALDAEVGFSHAWTSDDGRTRFDLEVVAGVGAGGVKLNRFEDLLRALDVAPTFEQAATLNPHAALNLGFGHDAFRVSWSNRVEQRVDLRSGGHVEYLGNRVDVNSTRFVSSLEAEYVFASGQYGEWSAFAAARYELDTLTLSQVLFDSGDKFQSLLLTGGVRARF